MLELRNINKRFGDKQILSNFNLTIPEKQILAIVGPSGGGKTTLFLLKKEFFYKNDWLFGLFML